MIDGSVTTCLASTLNSLLDGLQHPLVVAGISQGAFQVLQLGVDMPEFARSLIAIVPAASCGADCQQHVTEMEALIKADPDWQGGTYVRNPAHGLDDAGRYYFPWMYPMLICSGRASRGPLSMAGSGRASGMPEA